MPRAPKHCGKPGCGEIITGATYCPEHEAERQAILARRRGTATQRGYDSKHQREAKTAKARAVANRERCPRCGKPMLPGQVLDFGHTTARSIDPTARADRVEHAHCNRSAGADTPRQGTPRGYPT